VDSGRAARSKFPTRAPHPCEYVEVIAGSEQILVAAREAASTHLWGEAALAFSEADDAGLLSSDDLELYGFCRFWRGRLDDAIELWERAYAVRLEQGDVRGAARLAAFIAGEYKEKFRPAIARGWLRRAARLLETEPPCAGHAHVAYQEASLALAAGDYPSALALARECSKAARAFDEPDLEALALVREGVAMVSLGDVAAGLELVDEASAVASGGDLSTFATGVIYCNTVATCQAVADYSRAAEWTEKASEWCRHEDLSGLPGICRVTRAAILRMGGSLDDAIKELGRAVEDLESFNTGAYAEALYELGETHLVLGDLVAAEEAFAQARTIGHRAEPGLSMLRLAKGDPAGAARTLQSALADGLAAPQRARLLPTLVEAALAVGEPDLVRSAISELETLASDLDSPIIEAQLAQAHGAFALLDGRPEEASSQLRRAFMLWNDQVRAPYEAARARVLLSRAYAQTGDDEGAALELDAARAAFEALGVKNALAAQEPLLGLGTAREVAKTFMFTDIADSTRLLELLGDHKWHRQLRHHYELTHRLVADHGGRVVKSTGDGVFAVFDSTLGPLIAASLSSGRRRVSWWWTYVLAFIFLWPPSLRVILRGVVYISQRAS
jgi:tetratricopeptide (TPR) repeat protein